MRFRFLALLVLLFFVPEPASAAAPNPAAKLVAECVAKQGGARTACLRDAALPNPPGAADLDALFEAAATDPAEVERLLGKLDAALRESASAPSPALRADLLVLHGVALARQKRFPDAAAAARAAIEIDDGTTRVTWRTREASGWTTTLDAGDGRLARAAGVLAESGETREAREWLTKALAAGAGAEARAAWERTGGGQVPPLDPEAAPLVAEEWFPQAPDVTVRLHGGGDFALAGARGKVLLLSFWASWCAPCMRELPALQALATRRESDGLVVMTVNARETKTTAEKTLAALNVTLPAGVYDDELDRAFNVRMLPTLILFDREGRIRARWDSRVPDIEAEVQKKVAALLAGSDDGATRTLGEVLQGAGKLGARFRRELPVPIDALAIARPAGGGALAVAAGEQLTLFDASGRQVKRAKLGATSGRMLAAPKTASAAAELLSFRPGRAEITRIDPATGEGKPMKTGAPILDAALLAARIALATTSGAGLLGEDGTLAPWTAAPADACALAAPAGGAVAIASRTSGLAWIDPATGAASPAGDAGAGACGPILYSPAIEGAGATPATVRAVATGRFFSPRTWHGALATGDGQLVIVALDTGAVVYRARWSGIQSLAAGDLDGDGLDELAVGAERSVTLLGAPKAEQGTEQKPK